jgi:hypothetical protein
MSLCTTGVLALVAALANRHDLKLFEAFLEAHVNFWDLEM